MPRYFKKEKPLVYVFCEGESEQAYVEFLKNKYTDSVCLRYLSKPGLFEYAYSKFTKDARLRNDIEVVDEIWFFFDVEEKDRSKWDERFLLIQKIRKLRKPQLKIRLLMTTGCVEYWFLLHFLLVSPAITCDEEKMNILRQLKQFVPNYKKGEKHTTWTIATHYLDAVENGRKILGTILAKEKFSLAETDERNKWLCLSNKTFTTVHEAILFLDATEKGANE